MKKFLYGVVFSCISGSVVLAGPAEDALFFAISSGSLSAVEDVMRANPDLDINYSRPSGITPLAYAVTCASSAVEFGILQTVDEHGDPFMIVKALLKHPGIDVNKEPGKDYHSPLHYLSKKSGFSPLLKELLKHPHCNVDCRDKKGLTPLMLAMKGENLEAVVLLLCANADYFCCDQMGFSAVDYATGDAKKALEECHDMMQGAPLIRNGAALLPNFFDRTGESLLAFAASVGNTDFVTSLLSYGAQPSQQGWSEIGCLKSVVDSYFTLFSRLTSCSNSYCCEACRERLAALCRCIVALEKRGSYFNKEGLACLCTESCVLTEAIKPKEHRFADFFSKISSCSLALQSSSLIASGEYKKRLNKLWREGCEFLKKLELGSECDVMKIENQMKGANAGLSFLNEIIEGFWGFNLNS